jgi:integrase
VRLPPLRVEPRPRLTRSKFAVGADLGLRSSWYWRDALKAAGIRHIKLHGARHTCATIMHLSGVPAAVIAAWIGHKDATLTMRLYAHSQDDALKAAGATLDRVVSPTCQ